MSELERYSRSLGPEFTVTALVAQMPYGAVLTAHREGEPPLSITLLDDDVVRRLTDADAFVREMQRVAEVPHASLAPVVAAGRSADGAPFFATPASDAPTGHERVVAGRLPGAQQLADAGRDLARALAALHAAGIVHGIVEPDRIRFGPAGVRLEDAGLYSALRAAGLDAGSIYQLTRVGAYLSPEQQALREPDPRSDIYGLGASLYELLTGKPPYGGRTTTMVMASVLADEEAVTTSGDTQAPGHVVDAIVRALEKAPDDRWPNAAAFADALAQPAADEPAHAGAPRSGCLPAAIFLVAGAAAAAVRLLA